MKKKTKKTYNEMTDAEKIDVLDDIIGKRIFELDSALLDDIETSGVCPRCLAERIPIHLFTWLGSIIHRFAEYDEKRQKKSAKKKGKSR